MYIAICLSDNSKTRSGFYSHYTAEEYIKTQLCHTCSVDLAAGFIEYVYDDVKDIEELNSVLQTECGLHWKVLDEQEYRSYINE